MSNDLLVQMANWGSDQKLDDVGYYDRNTWDLEFTPEKFINNANKAMKHTNQLRGMANTISMRTTISPRQWQPWKAVSPLISMA